MKEKKNYKGILTIALLFVVLPLAVWKLTLSGTFEAWGEVSRLKKAMAMADVHRPAIETARFTPSDTDIIGTGLILEKITPCAETSGARIIEYTPYVGEEAAGLKMLAAEITLTGSYISILKVLDLLENGIGECEVKSVHFDKSVNHRDRKTVLKATIVIQQLVMS